MFEHHRQSIERVVKHFQDDREVQALILAGSLAHGFMSPTSDIDVMIIVSDSVHDDHLRRGQLNFFAQDLCTYDEGYVDGKYSSMRFLSQVAELGSEPARYAFKDAQVLFSRMDGVEEVIQEIARYPVEEKEARIGRFYAQFEAWNWCSGEALRLENDYLLRVSINKLVLFGGRLILAHNELLYPYHKWFLKVLKGAQDRPLDLLERIGDLYDKPLERHVKAFYESVKGYRKWEGGDTSWPSQFMLDSELNWLNGGVAIEDI